MGQGIESFIVYNVIARSFGSSADFRISWFVTEFAG